MRCFGMMMLTRTAAITGLSKNIGPKWTKLFNLKLLSKFGRAGDSGYLCVYYVCLLCVNEHNQRTMKGRSGMAEGWPGTAACSAGVCDDLTSGAPLCYNSLSRQSCYMFVLLSLTSPLHPLFL